MISNKYILKKIELHNKTLCYVKDSDKTDVKEIGWKLAKIDGTAVEVALFLADYKCEACHADKELTIHHLVRRDNKAFMSFAKYIRQRHCYYNQAILCGSCHDKVDNCTGRPRQTISEKDINHYKKVSGV
jgi:hypothetical protein